MADLQNLFLDQRPTKRQRTSAENNSDSRSVLHINQNPISQKIQKVFADKRLSDIILVVGGIFYSAHQFMLCLSSDVFKTILMNTYRNESNPKVVELQDISQSCIDVFPVFLQYFYTGDILLEKNNIMPVLLLAEKYEVKDLTMICIEYMYKHIVDAVYQGQLVLWFQYVVSLNQPSAIDDSYYCKIWQNTECVSIKSPWKKLFKACRNFIKWNLHSCIQCFNTFQCDVLVGLLKQSDLCVQDEMQLFGLVTTWLNHQSVEKLIECRNVDTVIDYMSSLTEHVMSYIRYPMILPMQMAHLLMVPVVKQNKEFFMDKMAAAMEYHTVKMEKQSSTENVLECTPRLYTSERWGKSFKIVNQLIKQEFTTRNSLFDRKHDHEMLHWELQFVKSYVETSEGGLQILTKTMRAKIEPKLQEEKRNVSRHVCVNILLYTIQNEIPYVVTVMQNTMLFDTSYVYISGPILQDKVNVSTKVGFRCNRSPFKLHVIITPTIPGVTDTHFGTTTQHVSCFSCLNISDQETL